MGFSGCCDRNVNQRGRRKREKPGMPVSVVAPAARTLDPGPIVNKIPVHNSKAVYVWKYVRGASLMKWLKKYVHLNMVIPTWANH